MYAAAGLAIGESFVIFFPEGSIFAPAAAAVFAAAFLKTVSGKAAVLFLIFFFSGIVIAGHGINTFEKEERFFNEHDGEYLTLSGTADDIKKSGERYRITLKRTDPARRVYCYIDNARDLKIGMRVSVTGKAASASPARNPGSYDFRAYCRAEGVGGIIYAETLNIEDQSFFVVREGLKRLRERLEEQFDLIAGEKDSGILKAVLLGDRTDLDESVYSLYRRSGIAHLFAISGLHMSLIGMGLWRILRKTGFGYASSGSIAFGVLFLYGLMTGFGPSAVRAVTIAAISFFAAYLGRTYDMPSALCVPAAGLLIFRPFLLTQASFELSFLAAAAVRFPADIISEKFGAQGFEKTLITSASVQVITAPVILYHYFEFPVWAVFLNIIVIPLMPLAVISGLAGLFASFIWERAGVFLIGCAHYILLFFECLCRAADGLPFGSASFGRPESVQIVLFYILAAAAVILALKSGKKKFFLLFAAAVFVLRPLPVRGLEITFLDVGQGDGIFMRSSAGNMIIDCGSSSVKKIGEDTLVTFLKSKGITSIDTAIVTHAHADHSSGITYLIDNTDDPEIKQLIMPAAGRGKEEYEEIAKLAESRDIPVLYMKRQDTLKGGIAEKTSIKCFYPGEEVVTENRNDESLVLSVEYGAFKMILTGDVESQGEEEILASFGDTLEDMAPVTVLKGAHHGSDTSSTEEFIKAIRPSYAVLSYGKNNIYGHPSPDVKERLEENGTEIFETALDGAVIIKTDGRKLSVGTSLTR